MMWNKTINEGIALANIKQQKKRNLQNERNRVRNSQAKSSIRTATKKVLKTVESKEQKDESILIEIYRAFVKTIDTAARKGIIKKETAARKKSSLAKKVNSAVATNKSAWGSFEQDWISRAC